MKISCVVCSCCKELDLRKDSDVDVEIQFQMNGLIFSQMHYAIEELDCVEMLFPDHKKVIRLTRTDVPPLPQSVDHSCLTAAVMLFHNLIFYFILFYYKCACPQRSDENERKPREI